MALRRNGNVFFASDSATICTSISYFRRAGTEDDEEKLTLRNIIWDLQETAVPAGPKNYHNPEAINNNEYFTGAYSPIFMSRNRVKGWDEAGLYSAGIRSAVI